MGAGARVTRQLRMQADRAGWNRALDGGSIGVALSDTTAVYSGHVFGKGKRGAFAFVDARWSCRLPDLFDP